LTYASPILSLGISPNDNVLAVGMSDGILAISKREENPEEEQQEQAELVQTRRRKAKTYSDFVVTDYGIKEQPTDAEPRYDAYLRKFQYSKALDTVLNENYMHKDPAATVALFQELIRRDGLKKALAGRQGKSLCKVLRFLIRHLRRPRFMRVLLHVSHVLIDLVAQKAGEDQMVDQLLLELCDEVNREVLYMTELMEVQGSLEMIIANSTEFAAGPSIMNRSTVPAVQLPPSQKASEQFVVSV
jgi:U3 small nucleolar RNA-associated protein 15